MFRIFIITVKVMDSYAWIGFLSSFAKVYLYTESVIHTRRFHMSER